MSKITRLLTVLLMWAICFTHTANALELVEVSSYGANAGDVHLNGRLLYLSLGTNGMEIADLSAPIQPRHVSSFVVSPTSSVTSVIVEGTRAYLGVNPDGVVIVDVSNPADPKFLGKYSVSGDFAVSYPSIFIGASDGIHIVDVSNPSSPSSTAIIPRSGYVGAYGNVLAALQNTYPSVFMQLYDVSDRSSPELLSAIEVSMVGWSLEMDQTVLCIGEFDDIGIVDIRNPRYPEERTRISFPEFNTPEANFPDFCLAGGRVFASTIKAGEPRRIYVYDVANPAQPVQICVGALSNSSEVVSLAGGRIDSDSRLVCCTDKDGVVRVFSMIEGDEYSLPAAPVPGDFNGDDLADLAVYNPVTGDWFIRSLIPGSAPITFGRNWGFPGCVPVSGDYDGSGVTDMAIYELATGAWFIRAIGPVDQPITAAEIWGGSGLLPVPGDYDGDDVFDLAVYDTITGNWFIRRVGLGDLICFGQNWGGAGLVPVSGDYNNDGVWDLAVYQESTGNWFIRSLGPIGPENPPICFGQQWGGSGLEPVWGDYNGDGVWDLAVFQSSTGNWYIRSLGPVGPENPPICFGQNWGAAGFKTVPGDYNGDGVFDLPVYDAGDWYIRSLGPGDPIVFGENWGW